MMRNDRRQQISQTRSIAVVVCVRTSLYLSITWSSLFLPQKKALPEERLGDDYAHCLASSTVAGCKQTIETAPSPITITRRYSQFLP